MLVLGKTRRREDLNPLALCAAKSRFRHPCLTSVRKERLDNCLQPNQKKISKLIYLYAIQHIMSILLRISRLLWLRSRSMTLRQVGLNGTHRRDPVAAELSTPELALTHKQPEVPAG